MKEFKDLKFEEDFGNGLLRWDGSKSAVMKFENGWGVKVGQGMRFNSSDDTYEVIILRDGFEWRHPSYPSYELHYLEEDEVTYFMKKVQEFEPVTDNATDKN